MVASYFFGACFWFLSLLLTYQLWGIGAVIFGLVVMGMGIVPGGLAATVFHGEWGHLLDLVILVITMFGTRLFAFWLATKADADQPAKTEIQTGATPSKRRNRIVQLGFLGALAVSMVLFGRWLPRDGNLSADQVFSQTAGSVVRIEVTRDDKRLVGSGFIAILDGIPGILTNRHVVEDANRIQVGVQENLFFDVPAYAMSVNTDLAMLVLPSELQQLKPLPVRKTSPQPCETVYVIGFPMALAKSITQVLVTATYDHALQFDAPVSSATSGGPLLDIHGQVIGIVAKGSKASAHEILQNLNFAVPVADLLLETFPLPGVIDSTDARPAITEATPAPLPTENPFFSGPPTETRPTLQLNEKAPTPFTWPSLPLSTVTPSPQVIVSPSVIPTQTPDGKMPDGKMPDGRTLVHPEHFQKTYVVNVSRNDTLKLRNGPGSKFAVLAEIPANASDVWVFYDDQFWDGDTCWCPVDWKAIRGYISRHYLPK